MLSTTRVATGTSRKTKMVSLRWNFASRITAPPQIICFFATLTAPSAGRRSRQDDPGPPSGVAARLAFARCGGRPSAVEVIDARLVVGGVHQVAGIASAREADRVVDVGVGGR